MGRLIVFLFDASLFLLFLWIIANFIHAIVRGGAPAGDFFWLSKKMTQSKSEVKQPEVATKGKTKVK